MMTEYKDRLATAMKAAEIEPQALADHLQISYQAVKKVLAGTSGAFNAANNARAARFLKIDHYWLATGDGEMGPPNEWPFRSIDFQKIMALKPGDFKYLERSFLMAANMIKIDVMAKTTAQETDGFE